MKRHLILLSSCAIIVASAGAAYADCAAELERLGGTGDAAIDVEGGTGTQAGESPAADASTGGAMESTEQPATAEAEAEAGTQAGEAVEGTQAAEAEAEAGTQAGEAVEGTQAAEAEESEDEGARMAALEQARAALEAGDEQGCMEAIEGL